MRMMPQHGCDDSVHARPLISSILMTLITATVFLDVLVTLARWEHRSGGRFFKRARLGGNLPWDCPHISSLASANQKVAVWGQKSNPDWLSVHLPYGLWMHRLT
jgi:hypothetical protein